MKNQKRVSKLIESIRCSKTSSITAPSTPATIAAEFGDIDSLDRASGLTISGEREQTRVVLCTLSCMNWNADNL